MLVAAMDEAGVDKAAIVQASTAYGHDNTYVAEAVAAHPKRFTGVFSVDVLAPDAVAKMRHWMERGLTGLRLFTTGSTMPGQATWFADPRTYPAWELCRRGRPAGLHADDAAGLSAAARADAAVSRRCGSSSTTWRGRSSSTVRPMRRIATSSPSRTIRTCS